MVNLNLKVGSLCCCVKSILFNMCVKLYLCNAAREEFGCDECFFGLFKRKLQFYAVTLLIEYSSTFYVMLGHLCSGTLCFTSNLALYIHQTNAVLRLWVRILGWSWLECNYGPTISLEEAGSSIKLAQICILFVVD